MLVNITYRIVTAEDAETVSFQLKSGGEFPLNRLFMPVVGDDQKVVFHIKVDTETLLRVDAGPVSLNGLKIDSDPVLLRPGDVLRLNGHSIEIHDCPTPKKADKDSTQFIDSSMIASPAPAKFSRKIPIFAALAVAVCFSSMFATAPSTVNTEIRSAERKIASVESKTNIQEASVAVPVPKEEAPLVTEQQKPKVNSEVFAAIEANDLNKVKKLLQSGVSADFTLDDKGRTPLLAAASLGRLKIIQFLVEKKVNLDASDFEGKTALMLALSTKNLETVHYLLSVGVDVSKKSEDGLTAFEIAKQMGNKKLLAELHYAKRHNKVSAE